MALIGTFEQRQTGVEREHSQVLCGYRWFDVDGKRLLQLDTYGSDSRAAIPGKVSQTLQLDQVAARELVSIIGRAFDSK